MLEIDWLCLNVFDSRYPQPMDDLVEQMARIAETYLCTVKHMFNSLKICLFSTEWIGPYSKHNHNTMNCPLAVVLWKCLHD